MFFNPVTGISSWWFGSFSQFRPLARQKVVFAPWSTVLRSSNTFSSPVDLPVGEKFIASFIFGVLLPNC